MVEWPPGVIRLGSSWYWDTMRSGWSNEVREGREGRTNARDGGKVK